MEILFVASEVAPFSKTGGLGDVAGALPRALAARGHAVAIVTPRYGSIDPAKHGLEPLHRAVRVRGDATTVWLKRGKVPIYFVEHEGHFGSRRGLYSEPGREYEDNAERFAFFSRAALALPSGVRLRPQVIHANDWQTGLVPWLLRHEHSGDPLLQGAKSVFTIHNLSYQGVFPKGELPRIGLPWETFRFDAMEFHDKLNFMKAGLTFADALTTVSPTYAREILTRQAGWGLDGLLRHRARDLTGILNGIDVHEWDPAHDLNLPARYSARALAGKSRCKAALQWELGLPVRDDVPLVGMIWRLVDQKGLDLVVPSLGEILGLGVQLAVLGTGRPDIEQAFANAASERPDRIAAWIGFDEGIAHRIEAGADLFLMPSQFEPCGLNQLYSLRYGTVPVVRAVGGLDDTVEDYDGWKRGTGFKFRDYQGLAMLTALRRAVETWRDVRAWRGIVERGMALDYSWDRSAAQYEALYQRLVG
jgi:starch synthase